MYGREQLSALRNEFAERAVEAAVQRYSREARLLDNNQLEVRYQQLVVSHRRMLRELSEEQAASSQVPAWKQMAVKDMQAQKDAFEAERFARHAVRELSKALA